ncbi:phage protease [Falsiroseomonas sp.]|uniref:phage protease n=1 Tax=Falsiroseomonas sp. TaxID=2870721 RepID=UPI0027207273|nr:phage protease [Falsiroseomonas sp.]MDO9501397.1 phage protease [Falsiroseomonas sp.]
MARPFISLLFALDKPPADRAVPQRLRVIPAGEFRSIDGRGPWRVEDAAEVIAASLARMTRLPIDENHSTQIAAQAGGAGPARGWITRLSAEADGIWADVEWTEAGRALLADGAYAFISPVMAHTADGRVLALRSVALTNQPAVPELSLLTANDEEDTVDLKALRAALGLADTADEAAILAAATDARTGATAHQAALTRIATAAGLAAHATGVDELVTALTARAAAGDPAELARRVVVLETQLTANTAAQAKRDAEALVDGAIRDGKPVSALRDHLISRCCAGQMDAVRSELAALPSINAGGITKPPEGDGQVTSLTAQEKEVARLTGVSEDLLLKAKQKEAR